MRSNLFLLLGSAMVAGAVAAAQPARAANPSPANPLPAEPAPAGTTSDEAALAATTTRFNAYVRYMNRALRSVDSLARYRSWVNMRTGPTGRERNIYGLYAPSDLTSERAAAQKALAAPPALPDLDEAMRAYIAANDALSPVLVKADGYYGRADYKLDAMAQGKELHKAIAADGEAFLAARSRLEPIMRTQKLAFDQIRLAAIEKKEGRRARWHVADVMMRGKVALDALDGGTGGRVDLPAFDDSMVRFGEAVKAMDDYAAERSGAFGAFSSFPDGLLSRMRSVQGRLRRGNGSLAQAGGLDMTFIQSDWNTMVTTSNLPLAIDGR